MARPTQWAVREVVTGIVFVVEEAFEAAARLEHIGHSTGNRAQIGLDSHEEAQDSIPDRIHAEVGPDMNLWVVDIDPHKDSRMGSRQRGVAVDH